LDAAAPADTLRPRSANFAAMMRAAEEALKSFSPPRGKPRSPANVARDEFLAALIDLAEAMQADLSLPQKRSSKTTPLLDFAEYVRGLTIEIGRHALSHQNEHTGAERAEFDAAFRAFAELERDTLIQYLSTARAY
jgi:hypothetical protein